MLFQIAALDSEANAESRTLAGRILDRLFAGQPESTRLIAVLHYVDRLTLEEVASEVGLSVSGVRKRLRTLKERIPSLDGAT
jgi:RNA polymerase sigma-70 factor (ECF subfamily)